MAHFLQRLGRVSFRRRKIVLAIWLGVLVLSGVGAATLSGPTTDSFTIPGTDSQQASDLLSERFPQAAADGATARVVFHAPDGATLTDPDQQAVVAVREPSRDLVRVVPGLPRRLGARQHEERDGVDLVERQRRTPR
nr:MMPL family transporter [Micromonospora sp. DSM 115978]